MYCLHFQILGFFWRELFSIGLLGIGLWPLTTHLRHSNKASGKLSFYQIVTIALTLKHVQCNS